MVLSFRFSVLLVDPRSAKAAGAKGINFLESPLFSLRMPMSACGPLATNRIFMADGRFRCEADMARPAASSTQSLVTRLGSQGCIAAIKTMKDYSLSLAP